VTLSFPNRLLLPLRIAGVSLALSSVARADDPQAEALYREGRQAAVEKNWDLACTKFEASQKREPAPGTLLNLADCEENRGRLAAALTDFHSALRLLRPGDERIEYAKQRAAAVEKRSPKVTVRLSASSPPGTTLECDGAPVDIATLGKPTNVDPGVHVFVVRAPGRTDVKSTIRLAVGEVREMELGAGEASSSPSSSSASSSSAPEPQGPSRGPAYAAFGVGTVGIGVGAVAGLVAMNAASTVKDSCPGGHCPTSDGLDAASRGRTMATVSTIGFGIGIAGAAIGTYLLLSTPNATTTATISPTGVAIQGRF
jgi:hypothetical protein